MSNLRELLNPEHPQKCSPQSSSNSNADSTPQVDTDTGSADKASPQNVHDRNAMFINDPLYNLDSPYNLYSNLSRSEDIGHPYHENCPDSLDCLPDTDERPQHTLPVILRCAILGSAKRKLTIRDIYAAMENKYPYYRTAGPAWKQSVRHHLSLSRLFERIAKPVTEPGFGSYWTVNLDAPPGTKRPRKRGRNNKAARSRVDGSSVIIDEPTRRGRPKKSASQDFRFEPALGLPSTTTFHVPANDYSAPHMATGQFTTFQLPPNYPQQFRLHSVHDLPTPNYDQYDDDEVTDTRDEGVNGHSPAFSDDVDDSIDGHSEEHPVYTYSGDPRTLPPPSLSNVPIDPGLMSSYNVTSHDIGRLQEDLKELQQYATSIASEKARMAIELNDAHAEIARLRTRNQELEQKLTIDTGSRSP